MSEKINPSLIKMANEMLKGHLGGAVEAARALSEKRGFVPVAAVKASQGMQPGMPPGAPMPPQAPGAPGAPMPPAGPTPAAGPMPPGAPPMDPAMMGGAPPMDPAMMGGAPPMDPAAGGMPPEGGGAPAGQPIVVGLEDLMMLFSQIAEQSGGAGAGEPGMEGPNEGEESPTTTKQIGARIDALDEKIDMLLSAISGGMPPGVEGGMPPGGEEIPPDLAAAMGGALPPDAAGGMPPAAMGGALAPEATAGAPTPMLPPLGGAGGAGGMPVMASGDSGMKKSSALAISQLAARLRK